MAAGQSGQYELAEKELQAAWLRFPDSPGPPMGLGRIHLAQGDPDGAYAILSKAVRAHPNGALVIALSAAAMEAGRPEEAADLLESLASVTGDDTFAKAGQALRDEQVRLEQEAKDEGEAGEPVP